MKLKLHITKNKNLKDYQTGKYLRFAITDLEISKNYPENFVTILPKQIQTTAKIKSNFVKKYKNESVKIAIKLLKQELKATDDKDIKNEIRERLKILNPKPKKLVKCNKCGRDFQARKFGYRTQKICYACVSKRYLNQS